MAQTLSGPFGKSILTLITLAFVTLASALTAHEVQPAIADLSTEGASVRVEIRLNAEAVLAGINLDGITDTNEAEGSADYDALRALPPEEIARRMNTIWPQLAPGMALATGDGTTIPLALGDVEASEIGDVSLPRPTRLILTGELPAGTDTLVSSWGKGQGTLILRHVGVEDGWSGYLDGGQSSPPISVEGHAGQTGLSAFAQYIPVGFDHILPKGLDHILFVLGLFFLSPHLRPLLWQVSAFTAAHTVTLALGALGWVNVPGSVVEPLIAASITFIAIENVFSSNLHRWRPVVVFLFGLLHGLGFASVLGEFGLPDDQFIPALLGFNVGVELGQLTVIAIAFLAVGAWFRHESWYRAAIAVPASVVIGLVGAYWFVERTVL
ncbi:membrane protein [Oceanicola sp. 22II-s10i]|uniref:HupE/UreJ family protein n=1 Tax=Oceanicola sp. 22II-s10i TaxID=1317116 RepID=UPI000B527F7C|nr:HupE/UreJ family protein [Oceanicola sp. 22II-s10i]OWU84943.1 membrane protein [Oceanicola sp. 22II-s10i]